MESHMQGTSLLRTALILAVAGVGGCGLLDFAPPEPFPDEFPDAEDVQEGDVSIVSVDFLVDGEGRFYTNLAHMLGQQMGATKLNFAEGIELKNSSNASQTVSVEVALQGYSYVAKQSVELAPNETKTIDPINLTYDLNQLYGVATAAEAKVHLAVYQGEVLVALRTDDVLVEPVNGVRWFVEGEEEEPLDIRGLSAVLVTPQDRSGEVQKLLDEAAYHSMYGVMQGYLGGTRDSALDQAKAIFTALKTRGARYTGVGTAYFDGPRYAKLPATTLAEGSANSFDASLAFASAFEALGMQPFLVLMEGHAMVGLRLQANADDSTIFIETTMVAGSTFEQAVNAAHETIQKRVDAKDPQLATIDIAALRRFGVKPVAL